MRTNNIFFRLFFIVVALLPAMLPAQPKTGKITFTATPSQKEVAEGSSLEMTYQLSGSAGGQLRTPQFGAFRQSGGTQEMSGMQFTNGDMQAQHTWVFTLTAPAPGDYTIPEASLTLNGVAYRSSPVQIHVVPAGKAAQGGTLKGVPQGSDPNLFVTTEFNHNTVYAGQQVICTINIYTRYNLAGIDLADVPKADGLMMKELERYDMPVTEAAVGGVKYTKRPIYAAAFFPEKEGKVTIPPVGVIAAIAPTNIFMGTRPVRLTTAPAYIDVKPLPSPAPPGFTGVVGNYSMGAKMDHDTAAVGEAFLCEISVKGNGNGRFFAPPKLELPQGLESFDPVVKNEESYENGRELLHEQVLEYAISAKQTGDYNCAPAFVWFDPDSAKYASYSPKLTLKVVQGDPSLSNKKTTTPPIFSPGNGTWSSSKLIGFISLGLAALLLLYYLLFVQPKERRKEEEATTTRKAATPDYFKVAPPEPEEPGAVVETVTIPADTWMPEPEKPADPPPVVTPPPPPTGLSGYLYSGNGAAFYKALYEELKSHFARQMGLPSNTITIEQITPWMGVNGYDPSKTADLQYIFRICQQSLYAGQPQSSEMAIVLEKARQFIKI